MVSPAPTTQPETQAPPATRPRAAALPVEERRAAIVAAALPLFLEHGARVTSKEIAAAAGIAEGTIFRVFDDKPALLEAIVDAVFDPAPVEAALAGIDLELPLEQRLGKAVEIMVRRSEAIFQVTSALATMRRPEDRKPRKPPELRALVALLAPDAPRLTHSPEKSARLLRGLIFAGTSRMFSEGPSLTRAEIVTMFLHGVVKTESEGGPRPC
ncbi:MAG: TetR family transcriptional regulator [Acidimicrobiia bacterium]